MDLLQLRYFQAVARYEHISRAAEELHVAQPSLSRTIARLEAELGTPLFDRQGRRIRLNQYGVVFLHHVDRALSELDDARRVLSDARDTAFGRVSVASETLLTITHLLGSFRAAYPRADVRLFQSNAEEMDRQLRAREVDFCVASQPLTGTNLEMIELAREEVLLAVPRGHWLDGQESVTIREIATEPFVTTRIGQWQRTLLDRLFASEGLTPMISCEGDEPGASQDMISAGLGIGLIPAISRQAGTDSQVPVAWVHLNAPDCHRVLTLVWSRDTYLSDAAVKFREFTTSRPFMTHRLPDKRRGRGRQP
ncbi:MULTISPECIES: LysR family transcriptional regulator [Streptomyces]|uniref:LysR family transcriptional regulator n=1 Tax=Streptomyces venezuelae TaxID=54571 RepID=A0A5P2BIW7_STRVZ|nr:MULTISPECIES: LysR family transcriptional regulator [Streptomyces]NEA03185.1 LysR family transcriptional regulator [Streptomyces sp. SID10116]MYY82651.1 LysR family transcriptional regulator [Streptomyces sp. SID335]MYZ15861.1 LysR family transcriptional regulator [Streptomyces sp. SID337]NDZ88327.1 LysR family transcriptional regulator [Streptomyces sp. SID10115]NEB48139.1 LysR family transcriptional regulator [Streptomyces sp. SID339]